MRIRRTSLLAFALLFGSVTTFAADGEQRSTDSQTSGIDAAATFDRLDRDDDGKVTPSEVPEAVRRYLDRLIRLFDGDQDGALSRDEFLGTLGQDDDDEPSVPYAGDERHGQSSRTRGSFGGDYFFRQIDRDGDGSLTLGEIPEANRRFFLRLLDRADSNGDQSLTRQEWSEAFAATAPGDVKQNRQARRTQSRRSLPRFFLLLDADGNRKLSAGELAKASLLVEKLDRDRDGFLSLDELSPRLAEGIRPNSDRVEAGSPDFVKSVLRRYDVNDDGTISEEEAPEPIRERFDRLDDDGDGGLDVGELTRHLSRRSGKAASSGRGETP